MNHADLLAELPPPHRLALAYCPQSARPAVLALLALDHRLGHIVRSAKEPMLAQLKLAWWRDRLKVAPDDWPDGEPLLHALKPWGAEVEGLVGLVEGWEELLLEGGPKALIRGREDAVAVLAQVLRMSGAEEPARRAGRLWGEMEFGMLSELPARVPHFPREFRSFAVLGRLSLRLNQSRIAQFLAALRIGLFGR